MGSRHPTLHQIDICGWCSAVRKSICAWQLHLATSLALGRRIHEPECRLEVGSPFIESEYLEGVLNSWGEPRIIKPKPLVNPKRSCQPRVWKSNRSDRVKYSNDLDCNISLRFPWDSFRIHLHSPL